MKDGGRGHMVGLNVITFRKMGAWNKVGEILDNMLHYPSYRSNIYHRDDHTMIGSTSYDEYPIETIRDGGSLIVIEGRIYGRESSEIRSTLRSIARVDDQSELIGHVRRVVNSWDGEYAILILRSEHDELVLFNDRLGRLPFFYSHGPEHLAMSREMKFIYPILPGIAYDRAALVEHLAYGCPLGDRTILRDIRRLTPASMILLDMIDHELQVQEVAPIDLATMVRSSKADDAVRSLSGAFLTATRNRLVKLNTRRQIVALSGGLDSRATLAAAVRLGIIPAAISYDTSPDHQDELEVTRRIAQLFNTGLEHLSPPDLPGMEDYSLDMARRFVRLFDGTSPTSLINVLHIQEEIVKREGHGIVYLTGLFGGEMTRCLNITSGLHGDRGLVQYLMDAPDVFAFPGERACRMIGLPIDSFKQHLMDHVSNYPREGARYKYLQFRFEVDNHAAGVSEDRNRFFFWTVTPFYSLPFFEAAYALNERMKDTRMFRRFLYEIDPRTCEVEYYNTGLSLQDGGHLRVLSLMERAVRNVHIRRAAWRVMAARSMLHRRKYTVERLEHLKDIIFESLQSAAVQEVVEVRACKEVVATETDEGALHRSLALFLFIDEVARSRIAPGQNAAASQPDPIRSSLQIRVRSPGDRMDVGNPDGSMQAR